MGGCRFFNLNGRDDPPWANRDLKMSVDESSSEISGTVVGLIDVKMDLEQVRAGWAKRRSWHKEIFLPRQIMWHIISASKKSTFSSLV